MSAEFLLKQLPGGEFSMRSVNIGETFHPVIGARREAENLYLAQFNVSGRCARAGAPLTVWDVGLGAAGNAMHLIECWACQPQRDLRLVSFDLDDRALRFALKAHAEDETKFPWLAGWDWEKILREQGGRFTVSGRQLCWEWRLADFPGLLADPSVSWSAAPELIFYDAYSPAKCWRMWTLTHWRNVRRRCPDDCEIAFHSRATALRVTLLLAGFYVGRGVAIGEKEETTVAATRRTLLRRPLDEMWLRRVRRSTSAEPYTGGQYTQSSISAGHLAALSAHPQFQSAGWN
ncbi:MAG: hypothetical protein LBD30_04490 [Verrucomicrobiales bacterium]|nr:hypothetical protein [Verrucomicrobiales bacterium]